MLEKTYPSCLDLNDLFLLNSDLYNDLFAYDLKFLDYPPSYNSFHSLPIN